MADNERAEKLAVFLAVETKRVHQLAAKKEEVRVQVEEAVRLSIAEHDVREQEALPEAQQALEDIVLPWWQDYTGIFDALFDFVQREALGNRRLFIADTILHSSPVHQRAEWQLAKAEGRKPFDYVYAGIENPEILTPEVIRNCAVARGTKTTWDFSLGILEKRGLVLSTFHRGYDRGWELGLVPLHNPTAFFRPVEAGVRITPAVEPTVLLRFADQIRTGRLWEVLERNLQDYIAGRRQGRRLR